MNIAIVDDLKTDRTKLYETLSGYADEKDLIFNIYVFDSGEAFLETFTPSSYDLVFLDIFMNGMSGIETAAKIRETDDETGIIFLTTSNECQAEAIHYHVYDYIKKEDQPEATRQVMDRLLHSHISSSDVYLSFYYERRNVRIILRRIASVVSDGNNLIITEISGDEYKPRMTISSVKDKLLTDHSFIELLRGIIVNMNCIIELSANTCILTDGRRFPVSLRKSRQIINAWHDFLFEQARNEGRE